MSVVEKVCTEKGLVKNARGMERLNMAVVPMILPLQELAELKPFRNDHFLKFASKALPVYQDYRILILSDLDLRRSGIDGGRDKHSNPATLQSGNQSRNVEATDRGARP